jgi:hypothetical protein
MPNKELQVGLTELISKSQEINRENEILRQAAKIIFKRTQQNPASVTIRATRWPSTHVTITTHFTE